MNNPAKPILRKPGGNIVNSKIALIVILAISIISGFFIYRSFAGTDPSLSSTTTVEGTLEVAHKDNLTDKKTETDYSIVSKSGARTSVSFVNEPEGRSAGALVRAKGSVKSNKLEVVATTDLTTLQTSSATKLLTSSEAVSPTTRKLAVVLYNFDDDTSQPIDAVSVRSKIFDAPNSANAFFKEESYGKVSLGGIDNPNGDIFGYVTIPHKTSTCDYQDWGTAATVAINSQGHKLDGYDNVMFVGKLPGCAFQGMGITGGRLSWVDGAAPFQGSIQPLAEHELTHNFGTIHANSYTCTANGVLTAISDDCKAAEYGDSYDVMGINIQDGHTYHSNNSFLARLGWLSEDKILTIVKSGQYALNPVEGPDGAVKAIRILRGYTALNKPEYLYLEYRQPYGTFDDFSPTDDAVSGVMVRYADPVDIVSYLYGIPRTITTPKGPGIEIGNTLRDGEAMYDAGHGIKIKQLSHNSSGVKIYIDHPAIPQPDVTPPSKPAKITRTLGSTKVSIIQWQASPEKDTNYYEVYRDNKYVGSSLQLADGTSTPSSKLVEFQDWASLTSGSHTYGVRAVDYNGNYSAYTTAIFVTPAKDTSPPTTPGAVVVSSQKSTDPGMAEALVCWSASSDNKSVLGYIVNRKNTKTNVAEKIDTRSDAYVGGTPCVVSSAKNLTGIPFFDSQVKGSAYTYSIQAYDADLNMSTATKPVSYTFK